MSPFTSVDEIAAIHREREHGGAGPIVFRRLLTADVFSAPIDFVDVTVVPPGSMIGLHEHRGCDELYFILSGAPLVRVDDEERRLRRGAVAVVRSGGSHALVNDTAEPVEIFVIQVRA